MPRTRSKGTPPEPAIISKYLPRTVKTPRVPSVPKIKLPRKPPKTKKIKKNSKKKTSRPKSQSKRNSKKFKKNSKNQSIVQRKKKQAEYHLTALKERPKCIRWSSRIRDLRMKQDIAAKAEQTVQRLNKRQTRIKPQTKSKSQKKTPSKTSKKLKTPSIEIKKVSRSKSTLRKIEAQKTARTSKSKKTLIEESPKVRILPPRKSRPRRSMSAEIREDPEDKLISMIPPRKIVKDHPWKFPPQSPRIPVVKEERHIENIIVTEQRQGESALKDSPPTFKSITEIERIKKGREQRIFLLTVIREENGEWVFRVFGNRGQIYTTRLHRLVRCSCFDYRTNKKPCKHIYFIIIQIAQNQKILEAFIHGEISEEAFIELDTLLTRRLRSRMLGSSYLEDQNKQINLKDEKDCMICFTQMNQEQETLTDCQTCKRSFHGECLRRWRNLNNSCPLCRSEYKIKLEEADPLSKLEQLYI